MKIVGKGYRPFPEMLPFPYDFHKNCRKNPFPTTSPPSSSSSSSPSRPLPLASSPSPAATLPPPAPPPSSLTLPPFPSSSPPPTSSSSPFVHRLPFDHRLPTSPSPCPCSPATLDPELAEEIPTSNPSTKVGGREGGRDRRRAVRIAWEKLVRWSRSWRSKAKSDVLERTKKVVVSDSGSFGTAMAAHVASTI